MDPQLGLFDLPSTSTAALSPCGRYRYHLTRRWSHLVDPVVFLLLNPSTADAVKDDPTVKRCIGFARDWGAGGVTIVNLFALRATKPTELLRAHSLREDVVGPEANQHLRATFAGASEVVCGWGAYGQDFVLERAQEVMGMAAGNDRIRWSCLGRTQDGHPAHPLYLDGATPRAPFDLSHDAWPSSGITRAGYWGSRDGLVWEKVELLRVEPGGFVMGHIVEHPSQARKAMLDGARSALSKPRRSRG